MLARRVFLLPLALAACTGQVGDPVGQGTSPLCSKIQPGPSPIRRLTNLEYNNTIRDLFATDLYAGQARPADGFAPEEEALGFNNNAYALGVTQLLAEQYMVASEDISARATEDLPTLLGCDPAVTGEDACAESFIDTFGLRAWRHPLADEDIAALVALFQTGRDQWGFRDGIELTIQAMLQSPRFLYRVELEGAPLENDVVALDGYEMAARLSFFLWASMPDQTLFDAAASGRLDTQAGVAAEARRMLADPRAHEAVRNFHAQWLKLGGAGNLSKDTSIFPTWAADLGPRLREETQRFVEYVIFEGDHKLLTLLTAPFTFVDSRLAGFYGLTGPAGDTFERVDLDPAQRGGILTQGAILAINAKPNQTSPVHRGKFVREQLLCQLLPAPPDDIEIVPPALDPTLTTRERFAEHSTNPYCAGCHHLMDPIGFGFEQFDGVGLWRDDENGLPIDDSGEILDSLDADGAFNGVVDLAGRLAASSEVEACMTKQWFRFAYGRGETSDDTCAMDALAARFVESGQDVQELIVALTQTDTFRYRSAGGAP